MKEWLVVFTSTYGRRKHQVFVSVVARGYGRAVRAARNMITMRGRKVRVTARMVTA